MVVPEQVAVAAAQFCVSPLNAHDSGVHGARVGQEHQSNIGVKLAQIAVEHMLLQLFETQIKLSLHWLRTVTPNQVSAKTDCAAETSHSDWDVPLGIADRVEDLAGDDHHSACLETHRCGARKVSQAHRQLFVL
ncbi:hypothetical protein HEP84_34070 [Streptomyces sp. RLB1-33]|nr:hypothetical protein HEP84_34070 [Streptomyces sp. RLB1-33]